MIYMIWRDFIRGADLGGIYEWGTVSGRWCAMDAMVTSVESWEQECYEREGIKFEAKAMTMLDIDDDHHQRDG